MTNLKPDIVIETDCEQCGNCRFSRSSGACLLFREYCMPHEECYGIWIRLESCFDAEKKAQGGKS